MKSIQPWMGRTQLLLGEEKLHKLVNSNVLVVGLGGVGGIAAEMIARTGVGKMTIVDADTVEATNRNRQIPALKSTEGVLKTEKVLDEGNFDYALDCIDTLSPKVFFIKACIDRNIPLVSSMGAGNKVDSTQVKVADIADSYNCRLAKYTRKYLHKFGIYKGVTVVFSAEEASDEAGVTMVGARNKKSAPGTISYMPAVFGCAVASVAIRGLYNR